MRSLGGAGDKDTEQEVLLLEHDVPHQAFSQAVLSFLPKMPWAITPEVPEKTPFFLVALIKLKLLVYHLNVSQCVQCINVCVCGYRTW